MPISPTVAVADPSTADLRPAPPAPPKRRSKLPLLGVAAVTTAAVSYVFLIDPNNPANPYPQCGLKHLTGLDCPFCGGLRGTHDLLHGNIGQALQHNALLVVVLPFMAYMLVRWSMQQFGHELPDIPSRRWLTVSLGIFLVVFTVVRNIPGTPMYWFNSAAV